MKEYCVVRFGSYHMTDDGGEWRTVVHRCALPRGVQRYRVCLHGRYRTRLVEHFDVHCGRYADDREETLVARSAVGNACFLARHFDHLPLHSLRFYLADERPAVPSC